MEAPHATVLVVDDLAVNRDLLADHLAFLGYGVLAAANGLEALDLLRERPADLILLDLMMPEMDGYATLAALKADPALAHVPVLICSAYDDHEAVERCMLLGAMGVLAKPINWRGLRDQIEAQLVRRRHV